MPSDGSEAFFPEYCVLFNLFLHQATHTGMIQEGNELTHLLET